jgi:hypothetical protein
VAVGDCRPETSLGRFQGGTQRAIHGRRSETSPAHPQNLVVAAMAFGSTSLGLLKVARLLDRLHLMVGFSAGRCWARCCSKSCPEVADGARTLGVSLADLAFFALERITRLHGAREHEHPGDAEHRSVLGVAPASELLLSGFLDGWRSLCLSGRRPGSRWRRVGRSIGPTTSQTGSTP